ncbi:uncharacterized protein LOC122058043 isoform X1 [Macadamia integrifolia]|uniref:uncharacterized protein LOC122058043 isoform X1 n=1 Tax=Macadamia integrifolia TaxID=60698 RepID=UPI001C52DCD8|nr:uncharacterized protein LOC122058043 isoform X1 [Macadamia integrifolia]XP_042476379.1 uncharacterized protein LOC122058043 isoform X1 [Macadamia integrifolia]XP_042476380.1 uncharacterized protein LOC122058043 isoform X1 [Macadamia integrifolia]XP_042476381.1 uncharacterized protein LOC122058043 isoform X1 [Macadamia integrifolia]XP_042476382.1 uncharacterized protein LOC122058043 isoform X1 [Macadamia integrifolia]XP_042476383.1 uncharacterized protein LOC122058043 isoform X1 [Macadamia i
METKQKMSEFRERLDMTLASQNLADEEHIKNLVKKQLQRSSQQDKTQEPTENIVEKRTKEALNFLDMLKSTSQNDSDVSKTHEKSHACWKLQADNEEFRVMYREGPQGTPFHMLLVEGFVDAPVDVCLCVSWQSSLYKKWWPQFTIPTFKITTSKCLQKVRIGEQICLVRMKFSWPLSAREAVVHFLELEFFEEDLVIVLINSISDLQSIDRTTHGFTNEGIPEEKDVIRIDVVGGFAIQKVSSNRSYFRTIATMDIKLEFVPPALINFVSRQLIGSGYKLYKKTVTSAARGDEDFSKALEEDPLYSQIREGLNPHNKLQKALICENFTFPIPEEDANRSPQANESVNDQVSLGIDLASEALQADSLVTNQTCCGEIEEELIEEDEQLERSGKGMDHSPTNHFAEPCHVNKEKKVFVSPEVENALGILNEAISMVRESRVFQQSSSTGPTNQESPNLKRVMGAGSCFSGDGALPVGEVCVVAPEVDNMNRSSDEAGDVSGILNTREAKPESPTKELIRNQIMPVSPEQNFPISSKSQKVMSTSQNGTTPKAPMLENKANGFKEVNVESNGILASSKGKREMLRRQKKKQWICCLHLGPS